MDFWAYGFALRRALAKEVRGGSGSSLLSLNTTFLIGKRIDKIEYFKDCCLAMVLRECNYVYLNGRYG